MARINLRDILRKKGISNKELAEMLGITPSAVSQMLANPYPSLQQVERIADVLNMDMVEMFSSRYEFVNGYIEAGNSIYSIKNREQFFDVMDKIDGIVHILSYPKKEMYSLGIKESLKIAMAMNKSMSTMYRYGVNQIFTLSYDEDSKNIFLSQCVGDGNGKLTVFETKKYIRGKFISNEEFEHLTSDILCQIDLVENNIENKL